MDILLDSKSHDLTIVGDDLVLVTGQLDTAQSVKVRWLTIAGEWFLDDSIGLWDFERDFRTKSTTAKLNELRRLMEREAQACPGVDRASIVSFDLNRSTRALSIQAKVTTETGDVLDISFTEAVA